MNQAPAPIVKNLPTPPPAVQKATVSNNSTKIVAKKPCKKFEMFSKPKIKTREKGTGTGTFN
jgi:hypothetical protein